MKRADCTHNETAIVLFFYDELDAPERAEVAARLRTCPACRAVHDELALVEQAVPAVPAVEPDETTMRLLRRAAAARVEALARPAAPRRGLADVLGLAAWRPAPVMMRLALAVVLLAAGFWWGQRQAPARHALDLTPLPSDPALGNLLLAEQPVQTEGGVIHPVFAGVEDVAYDAATGLVEIRYNTYNDVVMRGRPGDEAVQHLLQQALLDDENPAARLSAARALDAFGTPPTPPDEAVVAALLHLLQKETNQGIRLQALDALRTLYRLVPFSPEVKSTLISLLLDDENSALRIEALQALTEGSLAEQDLAAYLQAVRQDPNSFIRARASALLDNLDPVPPGSQP